MAAALESPVHNIQRSVGESCINDAAKSTYIDVPVNLEDIWTPVRPLAIGKHLISYFVCLRIIQR